MVPYPQSVGVNANAGRQLPNKTPDPYRREKSMFVRGATRKCVRWVARRFLWRTRSLLTKGIATRDSNRARCM